LGQEPKEGGGGKGRMMRGQIWLKYIICMYKNSIMKLIKIIKQKYE
jgi:hypothetical protein